MSEPLIGLKIVNIRDMTDEEKDLEGIDKLQLMECIELSDGSIIYALDNQAKLHGRLMCRIKNDDGRGYHFNYVADLLT